MTTPTHTSGGGPAGSTSTAGNSSSSSGGGSTVPSTTPTAAANPTGGGQAAAPTGVVGHVNNDPYATASRSDPAWLRWSAAWTTQARVLTGRHDLTVTVAPGAGGGAPACHIPALAAIEVDAALIGDPTIADPRRPGHKKVVPAAYGALVHEAAHAVHSRWAPPGGAAPILAAVADMLEESRAEYRHRQRRPRDRQWLRHAVKAIIAPGFARTDHPWDAAGAAALLLARVDTKVLTHADTKPVWAAVRRILGTGTLRTLRGIWKAAHEVHDRDGQRMIMLADAWCRALGMDPGLQPQLPDLSGQPPGTRLPAAVAATLAAVDPTPRPDPRPADPPPPSPGQQDGGGQANPGGGGDMPASWTTRPPTAGERRAAAALGSALRRARAREPVRVRQAAVAPPGRLATRQAIAAQAQQASGAVISAQPWTRTVRGQAPDPELVVAVLVDVSGSMRQFTGPLSSAAWILAHATVRTGTARAVTIAFGDRVAVLAPPGRPPALVHEMAADSSSHRFVEAVRLADQLIGLSAPGVVRLLVVVSDGVFEHVDATQQAITGLHQAGCPVLWLQPADRHAVAYRHTTTITVADPAASIRLIAQAATQALATA
jgi:hypothetical protein